MPTPTPRDDESRQQFVSRCLSAIADEYDETDQSAAICHQTWRDAQDKASAAMTPHQKLLKAIRARTKGRKSPHNRGILTADRYVRTLRECVGSDLCYRYASSRQTSFDDILKKSASTLTYNNEDMQRQATLSTSAFSERDGDGQTIALPKNTLMVFRHVLTTPRKDRDGDILRTQGAIVDPKMPLLWQHVHTLPIGKMLAVHEHNSKRLTLISAIVDINDLCHDAAVMIDNDMGRFSHGFRAIEFTDLKEQPGETTAGGDGFDVKVFEVMEASLVSVPSNTDAEAEEILLDLVEGRKLTSPLMKEYGRHIRSNRPVSVAVGSDASDAQTKGQSDEEPDSTAGHEPATDTAAGAGHGCQCQRQASSDTAADASTSEKAAADGDSTTAAGTDESQDAVKMYVYSGMIDGSWEQIERQLSDDARRAVLASGVSLGEHDWTHIVATFEDSAVICVSRSGDGGEYEYFRSAWTTGDDGAGFTGELTPVEIETTTEIRERMAGLQTKAGRVLSRSNLTVLQDVRDDLSELHESHIGSRSGKALCKGCMTKLDGVLAYGRSDDDDEDEDDKAASSPGTVREAMALILSESTPQERKRFLTRLQKFVAVDERDVLTSAVLTTVQP